MGFRNFVADQMSQTKVIQRKYSITIGLLFRQINCRFQ